MDLIKSTKKFIEKHWDGQSPLLLGYSGGPDSKALLYLLLDIGVRPHLAHIDHGWREESGREADGLQKEAQKLGLPFHLKRLGELPSANLEDYCRKQRHLFYAELFEKHPYQALLLGHQRDDRAETALKRVLEGASLPFLAGLTERGQFQGKEIWRPLLQSKKSELLDYLCKKGLEPICDSTNSDTKYLRARMRRTILPELAKSFGKEIDKNLALLSIRSAELKEYLDRKVDRIALQNGVEGNYYAQENWEAIEARHLVKRLGLISTEQIDRAAAALVEGEANIRVGSLRIDRKKVFILE